MELMRTEFFETLNPRGRKLTTRLQERWPLDAEQDRYEVAEVRQRLFDDTYRIADREAGVVKKADEVARLAAWEAKERRRLEEWEAAAKRVMPREEVEGLIAAGPPTTCKTAGVYSQCGGCEEPPSADAVDSQRYWDEFTVFQGKEGYEGCYKDAAKTFEALGRMDGFDFMFNYRFS